MLGYMYNYSEVKKNQFAIIIHRLCMYVAFQNLPYKQAVTLIYNYMSFYF